ncbi:MAG: hypothetical protein IT539_13910 [Bradyrhizobiaceae bacterium]|nr:hypothetical protein [Bradyrhizobiaceae bacterium]
MKRFAAIALAGGFVLSAFSSPASAQGVSAVGLIFHSSVVGYCEGRELTQEEAAKTAIGFSDMWKAMRDCQENRAKRQAAQAAQAAKKK